MSQIQKTWDRTTVTVADILELRASGLNEEEVWSLLCLAVQTLQDLFLSVAGGGAAHDVVPLVSPRTLGITSKGKVVFARSEGVCAEDERYLAPELDVEASARAGNLDREKMWVYSLGKTLRSSLKVVSKEAETLAVLDFMTEENPSDRASLMSLLNIISRRRNTNLPVKPFSHSAMDMYREVFGTPPQVASKLSESEVRPPGGKASSGSDALQCLLSRRAENPSEDPSRENFQNEPRNPSSGSGRKTSSSSSSAPTSPESSKNALFFRRNPVQRAPSRLYRPPVSPPDVDEVDASDSPTCVGPEFVVRGTEPSKVVHMGDVKASRRKTVVVILLTGERIHVTCDPQGVTCGKLFESLVQVERIEDNYLFGLACLVSGDFAFVPSEMKLHKVAPPGWKDRDKKPDRPPFFLYLRVKFFLPGVRGVRNPRTKHLLYLQLRRSLLERQIKCDLGESMILGGLALQAEFGDFDEKDHGSCSYFLLEHYFPEDLDEDKQELEKQLQERHRSRRGLPRKRAEEMFVCQAQRLPEYGSHHYAALWVRKSVTIPMWVTVNPQGVYLYEKKKNVLDRKIHEAFVWKNIRGLSCNERYFRLVPNDVCGQKASYFKLRMDCKKSYLVFRLASFHHQFFLKLRIGLSPLHALAREFGVPVERDPKNIYYLEQKPVVPRRIPERTRNVEEYQNKENENPAESRREKKVGVGVKMGVSAFRLPRHDKTDFCGRRLSLSELSDGSSEAYVIDSSIKSFDEKFTYDFQESVPTVLTDKLSSVPWEGERVLRKVMLVKDKYGSFGLEVVEGKSGGVFVESVLNARARDDADRIRRGDQLLSVNGVCLLNVNYAEALSVLRSAGDKIEILVSQSCRNEGSQKSLEREYLKNIRFDTAHETDHEIESKTGVGAAF